MADNTTPDAAIPNGAQGDAGAILGLTDSGQPQPPGAGAAVAKAADVAQAAAPKPERKVTISLESTIGALGNEPALVVPEQNELTDDWGEQGKEFGGDLKVNEFITNVLDRFREREKKGDPKVIQSIESKKALLEEFARMMAYAKTQKKWGIQKYKLHWLEGMLSRLDIATVNQEGINFRWAWDPHTIAAPSNLKKIPNEIPHSGTAIDEISDAMEVFLLKLLPLANERGLTFKINNRKYHSNGWGVDMYLTGLTPGSDGFWNPEDAAGFLQLFGEAARRATAEAKRTVDWHIIYNDPRVANEVNNFYKGKNSRAHARVTYGGSYRMEGKSVKQNYHGPDPMLLHFHLDVVWR